MANPLYSHYSIEDFDKFDCLKLSKGIYLMVLFSLRGYLVWLMSVTNMKDRIGIMQWIYPQTNLFYLSLFSGLLGLFVVVIISLRRPKAASWVKSSWQNLRLFLVSALLFDLTISLVAHYFWQMLSVSWLVSQVLIVTALIWYCFSSPRIRININEFPEELPEK